MSRFGSFASSSAATARRVPFVAFVVDFLPWRHNCNIVKRTWTANDSKYNFREYMRALPAGRHFFRGSDGYEAASLPRHRVASARTGSLPEVIVQGCQCRRHCRAIRRRHGQWP